MRAQELFTRIARPVAALAVAAAIGACGSSTTTTEKAKLASSHRHASTTLKIHPHVVEPSTGVPAPSYAVPAPSNSTPLGDPTAHAPPLSDVKRELRLEFVAVTANNATYINPLRYVTCCGHWGRTDQGVDATMPVGAPILAPCKVKILNIEPNWYAGQPLVYYELLEGPDAGKVQYVAEQITSLARPGSILQQGQAVARYAPSGTAIEFGWSTLSGVTLARATTGYEEGQITPAGASIRAWLNSLGAKAGPNI